MSEDTSFRYVHSASWSARAVQQYDWIRNGGWHVAIIVIGLVSAAVAILQNGPWLSGFGVGFTATWLYVWWASKRRVRRSEGAYGDHDIAVQVAQDGLTFESAAFRIEWPRIRTVIATKDLWLLEGAGRGFVLPIPIASLTSEAMELIRERVVANGGRFA